MKYIIKDLVWTFLKDWLNTTKAKVSTQKVEDLGSWYFIELFQIKMKQFFILAFNFNSITFVINTNMTFKIIIQILLIVVPFTSIAQLNTQEIDIGKNSTIQGLFQTEDSGFVIVTGTFPQYGYVPNMKYEKMNMIYLNSKLEEVWSHKPEINYLPQYFVSSNLTDFKYYFSYVFEENGRSGKQYRKSSFKFNYMQFDKSGFLEKGDIKIKESNEHYDLVAAFMDKEKLYLLNNNTLPDDDKTNKVEKPSLTFIDHKDKNNSGKIMLNINLSNGGTFGFIGFYNNEIYLYQHTAESYIEIKTKIFRVDLKGNLIKEFVVSNKSAKGYRFKDLNYERSYMGNCIINPLKNPKSYSSALNLNALIEIKADFFSGNFYFIGMEVEYKNLQPLVYTLSHCFISKCNIDGINYEQKELSFDKFKSGNDETKFEPKNYYYIDVQNYENGKFIVHLKDANNMLEYSFIVSTKEINPIEKFKFRLNNKINLVTYKQGIFSIINNDKKLKNKSYTNYVSTIEKNDIKANSFIVLNADRTYLVIKHYNKNKSTFIDLLLF